MVTPRAQNVVHVPGFPARFDRDFCRLCLRAEMGLERFDGADCQTAKNLTVSDLTECDLPHSKVESYVSHG